MTDAAPHTGGTRRPLERLSVVIPAHNEEGCLAPTVEHLHAALAARGIPHEIVVVDDGSTDRTWPILQELQATIPEIVAVQNKGPHGYGRAVVADDLDLDGRVDLLVVEHDYEGRSNKPRLHLLRNRWPGENNWIGVRLAARAGGRRARLLRRRDHGWPSRCAARRLRRRVQ